MLPMLEDFREPDLSRAMYVPLGLASPMWLPFAAATSAGLAFWWMTRWTRPANIEAMMEALAPPMTLPVVAEPEPPPAEPVLEAVETVAAQTEEVAEAAVETMETVEGETQEAVEAVVEAAPSMDPPAPKKKPKPAPEAPLH